MGLSRYFHCFQRGFRIQEGSLLVTTKRFSQARFINTFTGVCDTGHYQSKFRGSDLRVCDHCNRLTSLNRRFLSKNSKQNENSNSPFIAQRGRKRFYKSVGVTPAAFTSLGDKHDGFAVTLDQRILKTPYRKPLIVRTRALAQALANEWDIQDPYIIPNMMPLMTLSCTAIDIADLRRKDTEEELLRFLNTDTVLFPACVGMDDPDLIRAQKQYWTPIVEWFHDLFGPVNVCQDLCISPHPKVTVDRVREFLCSLNAWEFAAIESLTSGCKSLMIPICLFYGKIDEETAVQAARVEEEHQVNDWGLVEGGHDIDRVQLISQVVATSFFLKSI